MENIKAISLINNKNNDDVNFSEEMLSTLLSLANTMPGVAYWKTKQGVYLWHNDFTESHQIIFKSPINIRNLVGKTDYDIFPQNIADEYRKDDLEAMLSKNGITKEEIFYDQHNAQQLMLIYKRPMLDMSNKVIGVIGNIINITNFNNQNNKLNIERLAGIYDSILQPLKEIILLINLIETSSDSDNVVSLLSEINTVVAGIFKKVTTQQNNIKNYV